jgi:Lar family restriction alleviation protein
MVVRVVVVVNELLPCPFCGSCSIGMRTRTTTVLECNGCGAMFITLAKQSAIDKWNQRLFRAAEPERPYCNKASSDDLECE